jgi:nitroreductase
MGRDLRRRSELVASKPIWIKERRRRIGQSLRMAPCRRLFIGGAVAGAAAIGTGMWWRGLSAPYLAAAERLTAPLPSRPETHDLVRFATLGANGHNTQPWRFSETANGLAIAPDFSRRTPVVDPDDHHLYASLGCAAETLSIAARARGLSGEVIEAGPEGLMVALRPAAPDEGALFAAIPERQCTRSGYDGSRLTAEEVASLAAEANRHGVAAIWREGAKAEPILDLVIAGNTRQMGNPAFVDELKAWIRFNGAHAARTGDGLYAASSGNPAAPEPIGRRLFDAFFQTEAENDKYARHLRSSAGIFTLVAPSDDPAGWIAAGRAYQRMALRATAMGLRNAFVNQAVEEPAMRADLVSLLDLGEMRPNLVFRVGRAPPMPRSLRRPAEAVTDNTR